MEPEQIPELIAQIALADPRVRREDRAERRAQILMWAGILADVPYDFALSAAHQHYATSQWPILPANIATRWQAVVRDRMERHVGTFEPTAHPEIHPDDEAGYRKALAAERQAVVMGQQPPNELAVLTSGPAAIEVQRRMAGLGSYMPPSVREVFDAQDASDAAGRAPRRGLTVVCPHCRAAAGQRCTIPASGRRMPHPHPSRIDAAGVSA